MQATARRLSVVSATSCARRRLIRDVRQTRLLAILAARAAVIALAVIAQHVPVWVLRRVGIVRAGRAAKIPAALAGVLARTVPDGLPTFHAWPDFVTFTVFARRAAFATNDRWRTSLLLVNRAGLCVVSELILIHEFDSFGLVFSPPLCARAGTFGQPTTSLALIHMTPETQFYLSLASVVCGLLGTILLAFALSRWMAAVSLSLTALEAFKSTLLKGNMTLDVRGADKHRNKGASRSTTLTYFGLLLIGIASLLQIYVLCSTRPTPPAPSPPKQAQRAEQNGCRQRLEGYLSCQQRLALAVA